MKIYLVGGAVRDEQLGLPINERDWCVVGAKPEDLLSKGYRRVGKDFPVFLHPKTGEEYALARTEKKVAPGYDGFTFQTSADVSIDEDLKRRDLTINAMAKDNKNNLIDPFNGMIDLRNKILRHVSDAFKEDPVRILRTAKFAARFLSLKFEIDPSTIKIMSEMVEDGEINSLIPDRIWKETQEALSGENPHIFFEVLKKCNALQILYPEIIIDKNQQQSKQNKKSSTHTLDALKKSAKISNVPEVRFAALVYRFLGSEKLDINKALLDRKKENIIAINEISRRLPIPSKYKDLALLVANSYKDYQQAFNLNPIAVMNLFEKLDAFRRPERLENFLDSCEAIESMDKTSAQLEPNQNKFLLDTFNAAISIATKDIINEEKNKIKISARIKNRRIRAIRAYKETYS
jgi:tRNA nucleotidyltransferase (CCA-adding enzyme)